jgi:hypothetical protein
MCIENDYWKDIVETRDRHDIPDTPEDKRRAKVQNRKLGIPDEAPSWLRWAVFSYPPGPVNRMYRRAARNKTRRVMQSAIANQDDWDDVIVEDRPSRLDPRAWWY